MTVRPLGGPADVQALQQLASRLWPATWHPGGLGWALARGELGHEVVVIEDGAVIGWAARDQHESGETLAQVDPTRPDAAAELVAWMLDRAEPTDLSIEVPESATVLRDAVQAAGFTRDIDVPVVGMRRSAAGATIVPPAGYEIRAVRADETGPRVEVHRAAWRPATMPWPPDHPTPDPDATSSFTAEAYERVRATWLYDADLDLVAVAPDGSLAACTIAWFDATTGVAEIEPLGVAPDHRRLGLAGALCHEVARRVAAAGGHELFINTGGNDDYPVPPAAYAKAGFETYERAATYVLPAR